MRIIDTKNFQPLSDLEVYLKWVVNNVSVCPWLVVEKNLSFADGVVGFVIHRMGQFQTQLFTVNPNIVIPEHIHPNVDSYEVAINGMTFAHSGMVVMTSDMNISGMSMYVNHNDWHGGHSSENGGCFLSVQQWLNDVIPTSVGNDWDGDTMGSQHDSTISNK